MARACGSAGSQREVAVLYASIRGLRANLDELAIVGRRLEVLFLAETLVSDRRHPAELRILGFIAPQQKTGQLNCGCAWASIICP